MSYATRMSWQLTHYYTRTQVISTSDPGPHPKGFSAQHPLVHFHTRRLARRQRWIYLHEGLVPLRYPFFSGAVRLLSTTVDRLRAQIWGSTLKRKERRVPPWICHRPYPRWVFDETAPSQCSSHPTCITHVCTTHAVNITAQATSYNTSPSTVLPAWNSWLSENGTVLQKNNDNYCCGTPNENCTRGFLPACQRRVRKRQLTMFSSCLTHGALIRDNDRIPFEWCFWTQPR